MGQNIYDNTPQVLTIAQQGTGSFWPISIAKTPYVGFMITKLTANNSLNTIALKTTNYKNEFSANGYGGAPSGSAQEYLWYNETSVSVSPGGIASGVGGISGSIFSGSVAAAPFTTGSAVGTVVFHLSNLNSRYARLDLRSDSGGQFQLVTIGKDGG